MCVLDYIMYCCLLLCILYFVVKTVSELETCNQAILWLLKNKLTYLLYVADKAKSHDRRPGKWYQKLGTSFLVAKLPLPEINMADENSPK